MHIDELLRGFRFKIGDKLNEKYKIVLEYDGSNYVGWQKQENGKSIQESIEIAIQKLIGEKLLFTEQEGPIGVHAKAQVAHFRDKKVLKQTK